MPRRLSQSRRGIHRLARPQPIEAQTRGSSTIPRRSMEITYDDHMPAARSPAADLDITSTANPRVKHLVALRRRRVRDDAKVTLVEGFEELDLALAAGVRPHAVFYSPELGGASNPPLLTHVAE